MPAHYGYEFPLAAPPAAQQPVPSKGHGEGLPSWRWAQSPAHLFHKKHLDEARKQGRIVNPCSAGFWKGEEFQQLGPEKKALLEKEAAVTKGTAKETRRRANGSSAACSHGATCSFLGASCSCA